MQSDGWQVVRAYAAEHWGPAGYGYQMQRALANVPAGPDRPYELARIAEQVDATARAVNALVAYPTERITALTTEKKSRQPFAALRRMGR